MRLLKKLFRKFSELKDQRLTIISSFLYQSDARFEVLNARFETLQKEMNPRFEAFEISVKRVT